MTVRDTIGQIATGYTGTVFFSSSDVQAGPAGQLHVHRRRRRRPHVHRDVPDGGHAVARGPRRTAGLTGSEAGITVTPAAFAGFRCPTPLADPEGMLVTADKP